MKFNRLWRAATPAVSAVTLLAVFTAMPFASASAQNAGPLQARISQSIYTVRALGPQEAPLRSGSAVVIGPGKLVTACHLLAGAHAIAVRRDNVSYGATLAAPDVERDVCLLNVSNFTAPAVQVAGEAAPAFGQKAFGAMAAEGGNVLMRDGAINGMRAGTDGKLDQIQVSVEMGADASGGGLFDEQGRLIGLLTATAAGKPQTAHPAAWISSASARGLNALSNYKPSATLIAPVATAVAAAPSTPAIVQPAGQAASGPRVGEVWRYEFLDRFSKTRRDVLYRVDRVDGDMVFYNQGARVEKTDGKLVKMATPAGGEYDSASPPNGWVPANVSVGMRWKYSYKQPGTGFSADMTGYASGESNLTLPIGTYRVVRVVYSGYVLRPFYGFGQGQISSVPYKGVVWYAPDLGRVVKFEGQFAGKYERADEVLTLVEHRFD